jgi:hypothetical protein
MLDLILSINVSLSNIISFYITEDIPTNEPFVDTVCDFIEDTLQFKVSLFFYF